MGHYDRFVYGASTNLRLSTSCVAFEMMSLDIISLSFNFSLSFRTRNMINFVGILCFPDITGQKCLVMKLFGEIRKCTLIG